MTATTEIKLTDEVLSKAKALSESLFGKTYSLQKLALLDELLSLKDLMKSAGFKSLAIESEEEYDDNNYFTRYRFDSVEFVDVPKEEILNYLSVHVPIRYGSDWKDKCADYDTLEDAFEVLNDEFYVLSELASDIDLEGIHTTFHVEVITPDVLDNLIASITIEDGSVIEELANSMKSTGQ
jgi:hypothetical protein